MQTRNTDFIYRNELNKACFQHDMAYSKSKDLAKRTQSDKVLGDNVFKIASDRNYDRYQRELAPMVYKIFDKKYSGGGVATEPIINLQMSFIDRSLENLRSEKFTHPLETIFEMLI